jgi:hypothetical protein
MFRMTKGLFILFTSTAYTKVFTYSFPVLEGIAFEIKLKFCV